MRKISTIGRYPASTTMMASAPEDGTIGAREFYRQQLRQSFAQSRLLGNGRTPEEITDAPAFDVLLAECPLGSLEAARRVGEMAMVHMSRIAPGPWWLDLLNYERAHFMQAATTAEAPPTNRPRRGVSALCMNFAWAVPELLERLKSGTPVTEELRRATTLLFSRGADGKVYVVEASLAVERVFRVTNGLRTREQIAEAAGLPLAEIDGTLQALAEIGAVCEAKSAGEILEILRAREKA